MGFFADIEIIVLFLFLLLLWFITGIYMASASTELMKYTKNDPSIATAQSYAFWGSFITFTLFGLGVILLIGFVILLIFAPELLIGVGVEGAVDVGAEVGIEAAEDVGENVVETGVKKVIKKGAKKALKEEKKKKSSSWITDIIYIFLYGAIALLLLNGVLAIIATIHIDSSSLKSSVKSAYNDLVDAAIISISTVGIIIIIYFLRKYLAHKKETRQQQKDTEHSVQIQQQAIETKQEQAAEAQEETQQLQVAEQQLQATKGTITKKDIVKLKKQVHQQVVKQFKNSNVYKTVNDSYNNSLQKIQQGIVTSQNYIQQGQDFVNTANDFYNNASGVASSLYGNAKSFSSSLSSLGKKFL